MKIDVNKSILEPNDRLALENKKRLEAKGLIAVNVMASPGAGKTSLILKLLAGLPKTLKAGVIEGDVASSIDTKKIKAAGWPAVQINTGGGCHLDAIMVAGALEKLKLEGPGVIFIENIGNLICPVEFALGEALRLVVASVPEGDDKPIKYPGIFADADLVVLNKSDLKPHVEFSLEKFLAGVKLVNQKAPVFEVSCKSGADLKEQVAFLLERI